MFVYQQEDGSVAVCSLVSSVPAGAQYIETTNAPEDKLFRSAWELGADSITTNMGKAKEVAHSMRRNRRDELFKPLDVEATIPSKANAAEAAREDIRVFDATLQIAIDGKQKESTLRALLESEGLI